MDDKINNHDTTTKQQNKPQVAGNAMLMRAPKNLFMYYGKKESTVLEQTGKLVL